MCFSGGPFKEAAFHHTFTPRLGFLWSIAIQSFVAIHLFECFPAQRPILHSPPVLQFALSITLLSTVPHTLISASLYLVGPHCRTRRLLVSSSLDYFFLKWFLTWTLENLWESLFCVTHMFNLLSVRCFNLLYDYILRICEWLFYYLAHITSISFGLNCVSE